MVICAAFWFIAKMSLFLFAFLMVRVTLPRLRADQLMQFAWLILIPATLGNILLTGLIYLVISGLGISNVVILGVGLSSLVFLIITAIINWILLFVFLRVVRRATTATTRKAQAPAIRAQRRTTAAQLPERAGAAGGGE